MGDHMRYLVLLVLFGLTPAAAQEPKSTYLAASGTICGALLNSEFGKKVVAAKETDGSVYMLWFEPPARQPHTYVTWDAAGKFEIQKQPGGMTAEEVAQTAAVAKKVLADILSGNVEKQEGVRKCTLLELEQLRKP